MMKQERKVFRSLPTNACSVSMVLCYMLLLVPGNLFNNASIICEYQSILL